MTSLKEFYKNKTILVTGGCGSIGSKIVERLLKFEPNSIRVLDNNESELFELEHRLNSRIIRPFIGDVRDKERIKAAIENVNVVFHAAALKHVPLCEYNPFEAVKTNILGTENVISVSLEEEVDKMIVISSDKAVNPSNVMGATKLLAEKLAISSNYLKGRKKTSLSCVRFGNVLNSRGSVIPLFKEQIRKGGPVTVTNPKMTRFFMKISQAVELVLKAGILSQGGELFIFKMPVIHIGDLAGAAIEYYAPKFGFKPEKIQIKIIGKRSGEKMHEELMTYEDPEDTYETDDLYITMPKAIKTGVFTFRNPNQMKTEKFTKTRRMRYSSNEVKPLTKQEIIDLFKK